MKLLIYDLGRGLVVGSPAHGRGLELDDPLQLKPFYDSMT